MLVGEGEWLWHGSVLRADNNYEIQGYKFEQGWMHSMPAAPKLLFIKHV